MTTDQLRRFVTLAEELSFTRAARRLHIAQQVLSTQIKQLEKQVGAQLFERSTHHVALTPAGQELLVAVRDALATLDGGMARARQLAGATEDRLRLGFVAQGAAERQAPLMREFRRRHPHLTVEVRSFPFTDPLAGLSTGDSDVALLRHPVPHPAVRLEKISEEPRIVMVPDDHELATRDELRPEDLVGLPAIVVRGHTTDPVVKAWTAVHTLAAEIGERPVGAVIETAEEWLEAVEDGRGFTTTPASVVNFYPRPSIVGVPITGVTPLAFTVGWRRELDGSPLVREFVDLARHAVQSRPSPGEVTTR